MTADFQGFYFHVSPFEQNSRVTSVLSQCHEIDDVMVFDHKIIIKIALIVKINGVSWRAYLCSEVNDRK